jgi:crossover junction endodeoxyribonuclease RusA
MTARTFTLELPSGLKMLSLNDRLHWAERDRRNKAIKKASWALALAGRLPRLHQATIIAEYRPPNRHHRDADNIAPSVKSAIDGITAAGVFADDDSSHVVRVECRIGDPCPRGRLVLHITEVIPEVIG